jgi:hypothetical protein
MTYCNLALTSLLHGRTVEKEDCTYFEKHGRNSLSHVSLRWPPPPPVSCCSKPYKNAVFVVARAAAAAAAAADEQIDYAAGWFPYSAKERKLRVRGGQSSNAARPENNVH